MIVEYDTWVGPFQYNLRRFIASCRKDVWLPDIEKCSHSLWLSLTVLPPRWSSDVSVILKWPIYVGPVERDSLLAWIESAIWYALINVPLASLLVSIRRPGFHKLSRYQIEMPQKYVLLEFNVKPLEFCNCSHTMTNSCKIYSAISVRLRLTDWDWDKFI